MLPCEADAVLYSTVPLPATRFTLNGPVPPAIVAVNRTFPPAVMLVVLGVKDMVGSLLTTIVSFTEDDVEGVVALSVTERIEWNVPMPRLVEGRLMAFEVPDRAL